MHGLCLSLLFYFLLTLFLSFSFTHTQKHSEITPKCTRFLTFTPWLNYNLWFCSRPSSSIYSVMWFRIPTLERTACGVGCMFRFLQINFVCLPLVCDRLNQSNVNKHSQLSTSLWPPKTKSPLSWKWENSTRRSKLPSPRSQACLPTDAPGSMTLTSHI